MDREDRIRDVAGLAAQAEIVRITRDEGEAHFCRVDASGKQAIEDWLVQMRINYRPTFIRLSQARKALSSVSIYPTLGTDSTLPQNRLQSNDTDPLPAQNQYPVWYFFYGTLADPALLSRILELPEADSPTLRPATITGGSMRMWAGKYKALVDGSITAQTRGWAYQVTSSDHEDSLLLYETARYEVVRCTISLDGGRQVVKGCTFRFIVRI